MYSQPSQVLQTLVEGGRVQPDAIRARKFMLDALAPVRLTLPLEGQLAMDVARDSLRVPAGDDELVSASAACWDAIHSKTCDIPNPLGYAYRAAMATCTTQAQSEDPWTLLDFFILCARQVGVTDEHLEEALMKNYGPAT